MLVHGQVVLGACGTILTAAILLLSPSGSRGAEKSKALIVDGQNNHAVWRKATLMTLQYHRGRVFHTTLGHDNEALECAEFIVTLQRCR